MTMPFGKHRGRRLADLPDDYLCWLRDLADLREPLRSAVAAEAARRAAHPAPPPRLDDPTRASAEAIITRGYRALATEAHPDHGGAHEAMLRVAAARDALRALLGGAA